VASLISHPFAAPATGRLAISVWMRVADAKNQPTLQVTLEGNHRGERINRCFEIGRPAGGGPIDWSIKSEWSSYLFPVNDLPLEGLSQLNLRFDLIGPGEVWIDDVRMIDLAFYTKEVIELRSLLHTAYVRLQAGRVSDCMRLMEGYWPRFLEENVPLRTRVARHADLPPAAAVEAPKPPPKSPPKSSPGIMDRVKGLLPKRLRQ